MSPQLTSGELAAWPMGRPSLCGWHTLTCQLCPVLGSDVGPLPHPWPGVCAPGPELPPPRHYPPVGSPCPGAATPRPFGVTAVSLSPRGRLLEVFFDD